MVAPLNPSQFLPGTGGMREADPHEQTEKQFHNRPDVMVHGRYVHEEQINQPGLHAQLHPLWSSGSGFHSGTERAAAERTEDLGPAHEGYAEAPRYFHGRVDPRRMGNTPDDKGRIADRVEDWDQSDHDKYYRNDYEDKGSTSAIHSLLNKGMEEYTPKDALTGEPLETGGMTYHREKVVPRNFTTWRQGISEAVERGEHVPSHVKAVYDATGGSAGPHHVLNPDLQREVAGRHTSPVSVPLFEGYGPKRKMKWESTPQASPTGKREYL